jgi:hypothetical protein
LVSSLDRGRRLWRLRKLHDSVDAALCELPDGEVELQFFYNGALAYARRWSTRADAVSDAATRRAELERDWWNFHW